MQILTPSLATAIKRLSDSVPECLGSTHFHYYGARQSTFRVAFALRIVSLLLWRVMMPTALV